MPAGQRNEAVNTRSGSNRRPSHQHLPAAPRIWSWCGDAACGSETGHRSTVGGAVAQRGAGVHVSTRRYRGTCTSVADRLAVVKQRLFHAQAKQVHVVLPGAHSVVQQQVEAVVSLCTLAVPNRPFSRLPPPLRRLSLLPGGRAMCVNLCGAQASNATPSAPHLSCSSAASCAAASASASASIRSSSAWESSGA